MSELIVERRGAVRLVTLNRPDALNALTASMCRELDRLLQYWAADLEVGCVVVKGAGDRAFCAGGDIRAIYDGERNGKGEGDFFRDEYTLVRRVHRFPKPYIALIDGIVMGGGAGISINASWRVVTERTLFAMPETGIGLFPDVGATRFLRLCPGRIGFYLGLTGARLKAADMLHAGIATHYIPSGDIGSLIDDLASGRDAGEAIGMHSTNPGASLLAEQQAGIDRCFTGETVEQIVERLGRQESDWARDALKALGRASPTSLKITLRQLSQGAAEIEEALTLEYRMTRHVLEAQDFFEGIRAQVVDKDRSPKWRPASLAEVGTSLVDAYFEAAGRELRFD